MLSKREISFLRSLHQKKIQAGARAFYAEGSKVVEDLLNSAFKVSQVFCTAESEPAWKKKIPPSHRTQAAYLPGPGTNQHPDPLLRRMYWLSFIYQGNWLTRKLPGSN
jgi:hypothetical protein